MSDTNSLDKNNLPFPTSGRLAGIDYGTVRIGIAICDPDRMLASPYENYNRRNESLDQKYFDELIQAEGIVGFVVGLPIHTDGKESQKSLEARTFGSQLSESTGIPVTFFDERYTSAFAGEILSQGGMTSKKKKKRLDMIAAQIMLTAYLESRRNANDLNENREHSGPSDLAD